MNRLIYKSLAAIGLMGIAYYISNPKKYNRKAKKLKGQVGHQISRSQ